MSDFERILDETRKILVCGGMSPEQADKAVTALRKSTTVRLLDCETGEEIVDALDARETK